MRIPPVKITVHPFLQLQEKIAALNGFDGMKINPDLLLKMHADLGKYLVAPAKPAPSKNAAPTAPPSQDPQGLDMLV